MTTKGSEGDPTTARQTLIFATDLLTGDTLARQIDELKIGPRVDIRAINNPGSKDNGKLVVSATNPQLTLFNIGLEFQEKATIGGMSEERLRGTMPDVLRAALGTLNEARKSGIFGGPALFAEISGFLGLQRIKYGF